MRSPIAETHSNTFTMPFQAEPNSDANIDTINDSADRTRSSVNSDGKVKFNDHDDKSPGSVPKPVPELKVWINDDGSGVCSVCGKSDSYLLCGACFKIMYCSKECQHSVWDNHKDECGQPPKPKIPLCNLCPKTGDKLCGGCHNSRYCSVDCQKKDWKLHKSLCSLWSQFPESERPTSHSLDEDDEKQEAGWRDVADAKVKYFRGILLPECGTQPVFTWVPIAVTANLEHEDVLNFDRVLSNKQFPKDSKRPDLGVRRSATRRHNRKIGRALDRQIRLYWREGSCFDGSYPNKAANRMCKTSWAGDVLALGLSTEGSFCVFGDDAARAVDLDTTDLVHVRDILNQLNGTPN